MVFDGLITQCPGCETSFKVTQAQLDAAKGAVRCGACLQIFQALDHIFDGAEVPLEDVEGNNLAASTELEESLVDETAEGSLEETAKGS